MESPPSRTLCRLETQVKRTRPAPHTSGPTPEPLDMLFRVLLQ